MLDYLSLLQEPVFWRQLVVGLVALGVLLVFFFIYKKLKWLVLLLILGLVLALFYGQLFFRTYSTEGERGEVWATEQTVWQGLQRFSRDWLGF